MQTKLIKLTEGYIIVSDENKKENDYVYHPGVSKKYTAVDITKKGNDRYTERNYIAQGIYKHIPTTNDWYLKERKIIASTFIPELPNIDFNNLKEEFGIIGIDKLVSKINTPEGLDQFSYDEGFKLGFNKCLSLNKDKLYTEQQLKKAFGFYAFVSPSQQPYNEKEFKDAFSVFIQSLQQKEWDIEIETEYIKDFYRDGFGGAGTIDIKQPKITNNKIKILKIK